MQSHRKAAVRVTRVAVAITVWIGLIVLGIGTFILATKYVPPLFAGSNDELKRGTMLQFAVPIALALAVTVPLAIVYDRLAGRYLTGKERASVSTFTED